MLSSDSVTHWINQLRAGDRSAAEKLWRAYFRRLVEFARKKLDGVPRRLADEEDVALSAFDSFCRRAERGGFPDLGDRDDLWPLLVRITELKAIDLAQYQRRAKRGAGRVQGESGFVAVVGEDLSRPGMDQLAGKEPFPDLAAEMTETFEKLLACLPEADLRALALWKMEGYTNAEIAQKQGCAIVTVERRLRLIRHFWEAWNPQR